MKLSDADLLPVAARLGADVPFFLYGGCYFATGKGEILSPAPSRSVPHRHRHAALRVETGWATGNWIRRANGNGPIQGPVLHLLRGLGVLPGLAERFRCAMRRHFPEIDKLAQRMQDAAPVKTLLSGSGASVFSLFREKPPREMPGRHQGQCRFACLAEFTT